MARANSRELANLSLDASPRAEKTSDRSKEGVAPLSLRLVQFRRRKQPD